MQILRRFFRPALLVVFATACDAVASIAVKGADFGGATADAHCDRRFVTDGGQPSAFCQEVTATVAASQFSDDCRTKFRATSGTGLCPREAIIAGCKLDEKHRDGSLVWDWYYDIAGMVAEAGAAAGPDGGPTFADPVARSEADVVRICADRVRYGDGAELAIP